MRRVPWFTHLHMALCRNPDFSALPIRNGNLVRMIKYAYRVRLRSRFSVFHFVPHRKQVRQKQLCCVPCASGSDMWRRQLATFIDFFHLLGRRLAGKVLRPQNDFRLILVFQVLIFFVFIFLALQIDMAINIFRVAGSLNKALANLPVQRFEWRIPGPLLALLPSLVRIQPAKSLYLPSKFVPGLCQCWRSVPLQ